MFNPFSKFINDTRKSGTTDEWDDWRAANAEQHPIAWKLYQGYEDITRYIKVKYWRYIEDPIWNFKYRFVPKHRYNMVDTGLEPNYYDPRTRIIHAAFNELVMFVDRQENHGHVDWNGTEQHAAAWKEMKELVDWWQNRYLKRDEILATAFKDPLEDLELDTFTVFSERWREQNPDVYAQWEQYVRDTQAEEDKIDQELQDNWARLGKIVLYLWD